MSLKKNEMPAQEPEIRAKNYKEVALGYSEKAALDEAARCLNCKNMPCVSGCPVNIEIPHFIKKITESDYEGAYKIIAKSSSLAAVCGRVCPQESQCESKCVRGVKGEPVGIGRLERFVADLHNENCTEEPAQPEKNGHKVAVIGSGPSGLTCAGDLAKLGYDVTVFEALHTAGGVLVYGIPEFRLPKAIVAKEIDNLRALGVKIETNGVYSANEFLTRINLMKAYKDDSATPVLHAKNVAVVGGGNVAMDAARCAKRLGAENVYIVYRRGESELPARAEEIEHAKEEGIEFRLLSNPTSIEGDENGHAAIVECHKMELGEPDASGRRRPVPIEGADFVLDADCVIIAIGTSPNPLIKSTTDGLEVSKRGGIVTDEDGLTSREGVYAGGDAVTGSATVILAMGAGKKAAAAIDKYIKSKEN